LLQLHKLLKLANRGSRGYLQ